MNSALNKGASSRMSTAEDHEGNDDSRDQFPEFSVSPKILPRSRHDLVGIMSIMFFLFGPDATHLALEYDFLFLLFILKTRTNGSIFKKLIWQLQIRFLGQNFHMFSGVKRVIASDPSVKLTFGFSTIKYLRD